MVLAAVQQDCYALEYADKSLKKDKKFFSCGSKDGVLEYADKFYRRTKR